MWLLGRKLVASATNQEPMLTFSQERLTMFPSDLSFSKAIMADRIHRPVRPPAERIHRLDPHRPALRLVRGR